MMTKRGEYFKPWVERAIPIAISLAHADRGNPYPTTVDVLGEENRVIDLPDGMSLAGYDIADSSEISGLTNCGYEPEEKIELVSRFGPMLNKYGLFSDLDRAMEFKQDCDLRVREHAPFYIYAIYWREPANR
ncbi:MAG: hypothetical protein OEZ55_08810 [Nitrospinota bacterium]|nr:hypothetical protein [Nitrospinota bacterium]